MCATSPTITAPWSFHAGRHTDQQTQSEVSVRSPSAGSLAALRDRTFFTLVRSETAIGERIAPSTSVLRLFMNSVATNECTTRRACLPGSVTLPVV